jgi:hypothetical protein
MRDAGFRFTTGRYGFAQSQLFHESLILLAHEKRIVICSGPHDPHALHGISPQPRSGDLDVRCPVCAGHGQWNSEIDLVSQRSKRQFCGKCDGRGPAASLPLPAPSKCADALQLLL